MELLDILDEDGKVTGKTEDKDIIHATGLWHKEVEVWIVNKEGKILIQKRSEIMKQAPNKYSITAGHVKSGEDIKDAMVREIKEEIGIVCKKEELKLILIAKHQSYRGDNNAFRYDYFLETDKKISDFIRQEEEVSELKYITIQELKEVVENQDSNYLFGKWEYIQEVIKYLEEKILERR